MIRLKKIVLFVFFVSFFHGLAQDSIPLPVKIKRIKFANANEFKFSNGIIYSVDTLIDGIQQYTNRNHLGNIGLPIVERTLSNSFSNEAGFNYTPNHFTAIVHTPAKLKYYDVKSPFTELFFGIGAKKEQNFSMIHTQNITSGWNMGLFFQRIRSEGFYNRQSTNDNSFSVNSNFHSKNNRYWMLVNVTYNGMNFLQSGGIGQDSLFEAAVNIDKKLIAVNLTEAQSRYRNRQAGFTHGINFGIKEQVKTDTITITKLIPASGIVHSFSIEDNSLVYEDRNPRQGFYKNIFHDSIRTLDSVYYYKIKNEIGFGTKEINVRGEKRSLAFYYGIGHELIQLHQRQMDSSLQNIIAKGEAFTPATLNGLYGNIKAQYVLRGSNTGDYYSLVKAGKEITSSSKVEFLLGDKLYTPDFMYQYYSGNHFAWNNKFNKVNDQFVSLTYSNTARVMELGVQWRTFTNPTYIDSLAAQLNGSTSVLSAWAQKKFKIGKFNLNSRIRYQQTEKNSVIRLPELVLEHSLYYSTWLFKKSLYVQLGADVYYYSSYYANAYMPAVNDFYLQYTKRIGGYPYIDLFLNIRVKSARVFIKYEHVNSGLTGNYYYSTLNYPMPDGALKAGLIWRFFD